MQVADHICKLAKKGLTPSQIGVILRDSHGIGQVKSVTGSKVLRILKGHGMPLLFLLVFSASFAVTFASCT
jgi:small subunit ribosomal protein S13e